MDRNGNSIVSRILAISRKLFVCLFNVLSVFNKDVVLVETPEHGNIGDQAIALAEYQYFDKRKIKVLEISDSELSRLEKVYAYLIPKTKPIIVHGGGFLGDVWFLNERRFRNILKAFKHHRVIVFPQTVHFDMDTKDGRELFEESKKIYESHKNVTVFLREENSYRFLKEHMSKLNIRLVPDIVLQYEIIPENTKREGILLCMRSDVEKLTDGEMLKGIKDVLNRRYPDRKLKDTDMTVDHKIEKNQRYNEVSKKMQEFKNSELVITDRLHAMIFSLLTNTPCIALNNSTGKVKGVYSWIKDCPFIRYANSIEELSDLLEELDISKSYTYDMNNIVEHFRQLDNEFDTLNK